MIGINDILHPLFYTDPAGKPCPDSFRKTYHHLLERTATETKAALILMDPFYISTETDPGSKHFEVLKFLPEFCGIVDDLARKFGATHVKTHEEFQKQLKYRPGNLFSGDNVHPDEPGHLLLALKWLEAIDW
jgi:lysophospholipase L1-like esterase